MRAHPGHNGDVDRNEDKGCVGPWYTWPSEFFFYLVVDDTAVTKTIAAGSQFAILSP